MSIFLEGRPCSSGSAEGKALVSNQPVFPNDINFNTGVVEAHDHELEGQCVTGKILIYPEGKGSTGGSWGIYVLTRITHKGPKAIINQQGDIPTIIGAIISGIPMIHRLDKDPFKIIKTGDYVKVNADKGRIEVIKRT